jgi:hypothetical protein
MVAAPPFASPTIQPSEELVITIDLRLGVPPEHGLGKTAFQVVPSGVRITVQESPTAQPVVGEDIATLFRFTVTGLDIAVIVPPKTL